jgi:hypothetical protein
VAGAARSRPAGRWRRSRDRVGGQSAGLVQAGRRDVPRISPDARALAVTVPVANADARAVTVPVPVTVADAAHADARAIAVTGPVANADAAHADARAVTVTGPVANADAAGSDAIAVADAPLVGRDHEGICGGLKLGDVLPPGGLFGGLVVSRASFSVHRLPTHRAPARPAGSGVAGRGGGLAAAAEE